MEMFQFSRGDIIMQIQDMIDKFYLDKSQNLTSTTDDIKLTASDRVVSLDDMISLIAEIVACQSLGNISVLLTIVHKLRDKDKFFDLISYGTYLYWPTSIKVFFVFNLY